jgi:hypothetical protein
MIREEVYALIDGEREYQDRKWGGQEHDQQHPPEDFIVFISGYVRSALQGVYEGTQDREFILSCLRKIGALAVAAMEVHGAPARAAQE